MRTRIVVMLLSLNLAHADTERMLGLWQRYATSKTAAGAQDLLDEGVPALTALVDLLYPPGLSAAETAKVEALVQQLGARRYRDREKATAALMKMGAGVAHILAQYRNSEDAEIKARVVSIIRSFRGEKVWHRTHGAALRSRARGLLLTRWPLREIRIVARKRLEALARAEEANVGKSLLTVLLASLRVSVSAKDRGRLTTVLKTGNADGVRATLAVLPSALMDVLGEKAAHWKEAPPAHDYGDVYGLLLDVKRPAVFSAAMRAAPRDAALAARLRAALPRAGVALRAEIQAFLWLRFKDAGARDHLLERLRSERYSVFRKALAELTDPKVADAGGDVVVEALAKILEGDDKRRRLRVLERLRVFDFAGPRTRAIGALAPFLVSEIAAERKAAAESLVAGEEYGKQGTIFARLAKEHPDEAVREAAEVLRKKRHGQ